MNRITALLPAALTGFLMVAALHPAWTSSAAARPVTPAEQRHSPFTGSMPHCGSIDVLRRIQRHFSQRERTYWHTGKEILDFHHPRQIGYRSNGRDLIPKRYCTARAQFNDGRKRRVSFAIAEEMGMAGRLNSWGVEWCVHGLDYNLGFAPDCKMARP
ncbi:MAG: hypothetical protein NWT00_11165 [Beijerinckiaceae bacterium]|nr:hypothetical protein [Beijerinckiaceae bacterium]